MQRKVKDLSGQRFNKFVVLARAESAPHGHTQWLCRCDCGVEKVVRAASLKTGSTKSCGCYYRSSRIRYGQDNPAWKGRAGRYKTKQGYIRLDGKQHDLPIGCPSQAYEHVVVMMSHLGRPLFPQETVHHKNGIRDDNRIENLELKASNHGKGQSIPDLISWAKEILFRYDPKSLVT